MNSTSPDTDIVTESLEKQRENREVKEIFQSIESLKTIPHFRKHRWVWELLQNARDVAKYENSTLIPVNIIITIESKRLIFSHDGSSFTLDEIVSLVSRTSTKSYDNSNGNTGKYGTGFVTSHVLNLKVQVSGLLKIDNNYKTLSVLVDRSGDGLVALKAGLNDSLNRIRKICTEEAFQTNNLDQGTSYEFDLTENSYKLAQESIEELKANLAFTLLINRKRLNSVTIINTEKNTQEKFKLKEPCKISEELFFSEIENQDNQELAQKGLLHTIFDLNDYIIGIPAKRIDSEKFHLEDTGQKAKLYKEFPLIGTEGWKIPVFYQSDNFQPPEERDGIRTLKENETKPDFVADINRECLIAFRDASIRFFKSLQTSGVDGLHLIAESGFPDERLDFTSREWYVENIQRIIRNYLITLPLVHTKSGSVLLISQAKFPCYFLDKDINDRFYSLASSLYGDSFPDQKSFQSWQMIIFQDSSYWGNQVICDPETLAKDVTAEGGPQKLKLLDKTVVSWFNDLIEFMYDSGNAKLAEYFPIYVNENNSLKRKQELAIDPGLNKDLKEIANSLGHPLKNKLLNTEITKIDGITTLQINEFFEELNTLIGKLEPAKIELEKVKALFKLLSIFRNSKAIEREKWFDLSKQLLPEIVPQKIYVNDLEDFEWRSCIFSTLKYSCHLISQSTKISNFSNTYFESNKPETYKWLNSFYEVIDNNEIFRRLFSDYEIIPLQNDTFSKLKQDQFAENPEEYFDPIFKVMYTSAIKKDCKTFLIDPGVKSPVFTYQNQDILTNEIDNLFSKINSEDAVSEGGTLNKLFHDINNWAREKGEEETRKLFPHFQSRRPNLCLKAFGPVLSRIAIMVSDSNKSEDEINSLINLPIAAYDIQTIIKATEYLGGSNELVIAAKQIIVEAEKALWRRTIGTAAEDAFKEAIAELTCLDLDNPDDGFDFSIHYKEAKYLLEIKSTVQFNESIKMSKKQGQTATLFSKQYSLCVLSRPESDTLVDKDFFIANARFLPTIGSLVSKKVEAMDSGLISIGQYKSGEISTALDNEQYGVFVGKKEWSNGLSFKQFIDHLSIFFGIDLSNENTAPSN